MDNIVSQKPRWERSIGHLLRDARCVVNSMIVSLAGGLKYEDWPAKELWDELLGMMGSVELDNGDVLSPKED